MSLPNLDADRRSHVEKRLGDEGIVWLTTVRSDRQPQTSPVGFVWDGQRFLIISQPGTPKVRNIRSNPKVSLHLDTERDAVDGGVVTLEGTAALEDGPLHGEEASVYLERYGPDMRAQGLTPDEAFSEYSTVIRVTPTRVRSY